MGDGKKRRGAKERKRKEARRGEGARNERERPRRAASGRGASRRRVKTERRRRSSQSASASRRDVLASWWLLRRFYPSFRTVTNARIDESSNCTRSRNLSTASLKSPFEFFYIELPNYFVSRGELRHAFVQTGGWFVAIRPREFAVHRGKFRSIECEIKSERIVARCAIGRHIREEEECFHRKGRRIVPLEEAHWIVTSRDTTTTTTTTCRRGFASCAWYFSLFHIVSPFPSPSFFSRTCVSRNRLATKDQPRREKESSRKRHGNLLLVRSFFPSHFSPLSFSFSLSLFFSFSIFSPTSPRIDEQSFLCASVDGSSPLTSLDICRLLSFGK